MENPHIFDIRTTAYSIEYFEQQMESEVAYSLRHQMPLTLALFSVDHYEDLFEAFGESARDQILRRVVDEVRNLIRTEDVLARYGTSEFGLLCRGIPLRAAEYLTTRIRQSIEGATISHQGMEVPVTVSIGLASLSPKTEAPLDMVRSAEGALARAQASGNCIVVADDATDESTATPSP
ncbi:MAG: GGDEF domain-containing protein [Myxococcota bacterium]